MTINGKIAIDTASDFMDIYSEFLNSVNINSSLIPITLIYNSNSNTFNIFLDKKFETPNLEQLQILEAFEDRLRIYLSEKINEITNIVRN